MSGLNVGMITLMMFGAMIVLMAAGYPIAFCLAAVGIISTIFIWNVSALGLIILKVYGLLSNIVLLAIPLFVLMGCILERSGIADDLYTLMYGTIGRLRGGLAIGTVLICTIMAAMTGVSAAATVTMGVVALPSMLRRNYNKDIATGCIMAGGALGILIPPSITMILFALYAQASVGRLFAGGVFPGLLLSVLFCIYIGVRSYLQPALCPAVEHQEAFTLKQAAVASKALILPILLIVSVLGAIFSGIATPTEGGAVALFGAILAAIVRGKFSLGRFKEALFETFNLNSMIFWIVIGAALFTSVYIALGAPRLITAILTGLQVNRWFIIIAMQLSLFVLGCFVDPIGIIILTTPIYVPVIQALGFDVIWYGVLFTMNMEMAFLTPPLGFNLFYMKAVAPPEITMADLYRAIIPFVAIQALGLAMVMIFPQIALFLPDLLLRPR